ncbi:hypothetical protein [Paraburkholderia ginsengisoli]|uniref:Uncharacterized protein n=1 Tax=Paraburkholderia ginsengisoli TaxID=311231 RepID=A0A7T4N201_9BURK|nr:hypothetical protein [Paraburkholderia ginsengisoli]QQC63793.1 hypothetical protein I6I06_16100 [Paraburkholderia ginsengisoli]
MAVFNFNELPTDPAGRRAALFSAVISRLETIDDVASKVTSIALAGALHAKGDEARHDDGDCISRDLFEVIRGYSENAEPHAEALAAVIALRDGFAA